MTATELIVPLAAAGATHLAMWNAGSWIRERLRRGAVRDDDPSQRAFQSALLGFAVLGTGAFALGAAHVLYAPLVGGVIVLLAAAGFWRLARTRPWGVPTLTISDVPFYASAAFVVAHLPKALYPVLEHDENVYHLLLPKLYLAAHALCPQPWSMYANMPHLVDLSFVFPTSLGGFSAAKVFVLGFFGWTLVGLAPFGRAILGPIGPGVLAALYLSGRVVQWHLGLAYVEPVIGALLLGAVQSLSRYRESGEIAELRILALMAGAACASKYTAWPLAAVLLAIVPLLRPRGGRPPGVRALAVVVGLCALLVVPWLVKNALVTGNPIYPNAYGVFGGTWWSPIQAVQFEHGLGYGRGADAFVAYLKLPLRVVTEPYYGRLAGASFSGSLMALLIASIVLPWRRAEFGTTLRLLAIASFVFWCLGSPQTRFLVAFLPIMVVAAGWALAPLRRVRAGLAASTIAVTAVALVQILRQPYPTEPVLDVVTVSRDELLSRNLCWDLAAELNRVVPPGGRVMSFWENRLYFLDRPFVTDSNYEAPALLARLRESGNARRFAETCAAEGFTHVVVNPYFHRSYMTDRFPHTVIAEPLYPVESLRADKELFDRFIEEELTEVPWDGGWPVFRLNAAPGVVGR